MKTLFAVSIFLGAFLLFQVQPIIGKYILPWFGGTSAVWITSLLFFQVLLLLGYVYAYLLSRFSITVQALLHIVLTITISATIFYLFSVGDSPITPDQNFKLSDTTSPIFQVLTFLLFAIGLPYFILSTTSTVLQNWFGIIEKKQSPYMLYALSNAGSLLGILSYPFFIEPFFSIQTQGFWWAIIFLLYGAFLCICSIKVLITKHPTKTVAAKKEAPIRIRTFAHWILLAATSCIMLLAITTMMTLSIAPIPFLWLLPLGLYLLSFIICFSNGKWYWRNFYAYVFLITGPLCLVFTQAGSPSVWIGIASYSLALFSSCMLCHGELYQLKPPAAQLNIFYLFVALGGALGGIFVGIAAPLLFKGLWEIYVGFYLSLLIAFFALIRYKDSSVYRNMHVYFLSSKEFYLFILIGFPMVLFTVALTINLLNGYKDVKMWRNFYGVLSVKTKQVNKDKISYLMHGNIVHGSQISGAKRYEPTTYYHKKSGVGILMQNFPRTQKGLRVGLVGLGTGTLAVYGQQGDYYRFYDINPQIVQIAKNDFTYLKDSKAKIDIVLGDGRLSLKKESQNNEKETFDILTVDAFSDDAIPVHLLTKEALEVYLKRVSPKGVIAFHISNNYLELKPLISALAKGEQLETAFITTPGGKEGSKSEWVLVTRDKNLFTIPAIAVAKTKDTKFKEIRPWTDTYSNLFQILK